MKPFVRFTIIFSDFRAVLTVWAHDKDGNSSGLVFSDLYSFEFYHFIHLPNQSKAFDPKICFLSHGDYLISHFVAHPAEAFALQPRCRNNLVGSNRAEALFSPQFSFK